MKEELNAFIEKKIVLDTRTSWIYIGTLKRITPKCIVLADADVHNNADSPTTKEVYVMESKGAGVIPNRDEVYVNLDYIVSFSLLDSVKRF